ncbi:hypothetical protein TWF481_003231 [Arthrobotrys musiformis]|uniref:Peptidase S8/S53 domain-containing protein n=1 Tax=Arthrobotrys musiformis TaxID=47236 RepID=A0AAV9VVZ1_9PEZI
MKNKPIYQVLFIGLFCLIRAAALIQRDGIIGKYLNQISPRGDTKPIRDLGWTQGYENDEMVECALIVKQKYWNDRVAHAHIRDTLVKNVLGKDPQINKVEYNAGNDDTMYCGQWHHGIGRAFYMVSTEYGIIADVILDDLKEYLGAWLDSPLERRLIDQMLNVDHGRQYTDYGTGYSSSGGSSDSEGSGPRKPQFGRFWDIRALTCPPKGAYGRNPDWDDWMKSRDSYFRGNQGKGVDVYVVDSGFAPSAAHHQAFGTVYHYQQVGSWIRTGGISPSEYSLVDYDSKTFHGTDVTSKIVGSTTGLATKANVIAVVFNADADRNRNQHLYAENLLNIRRRILDDPNQAKAIINLSTVLDGHRRNDKGDLKGYSFLTAIEREYFDLVSIYADVALDALLGLENVIVVTGTGNGEVGDPIIDWPAKRGTKKTSNLVVVGNADENGRLAGHVETEYVKVYGTTKHITVPHIRSNSAARVLPYRENYVEEEGISLVVPSISGILASHMSDHPGLTAIEVVDKLYKDAYPLEKDSNIKLAWTGPRDNLKKRSQTSGDLPESEDDVNFDDKEDKGTGKVRTDKASKGDGDDETDKKSKGTGGDETGWDDAAGMDGDGTDKEDKGTGEDGGGGWGDVSTGDDETGKKDKGTGKPGKTPCQTSWKRLRRHKRSEDDEDDETSKGRGSGRSKDDGFDDTFSDPSEEDIEDCSEDENDEEDIGDPAPPRAPTYQSTITIAMHITSVVITPKATPKPTSRKSSTRKPTTTKPPTYTRPGDIKGWDGTKHAAVELMSRPPPVKTFIKPDPLPDVGDIGWMLQDSQGGRVEPVANPAPRPGMHQKPVLDRKAMLRASTNIFRGYTSTRKRPATYTPGPKDNQATVTMIYTTVYGTTGDRAREFKAARTGNPASVTITSSNEPSKKPSTYSKTLVKTTIETSTAKPAVKVANSTVPEAPSNTRSRGS